VSGEVEVIRILTSRNASISETIIAIADSMKKKRIIFFLSDPNIFFMDTSFALLEESAVLIFTKLNDAIS
jgi:predicted glycosyltransferase